jgi:hypothetical protein
VAFDVFEPLEGFFVVHNPDPGWGKGLASYPTPLGGVGR